MDFDISSRMVEVPFFYSSTLTFIFKVKTFDILLI